MTGNTLSRKLDSAIDEFQDMAIEELQNEGKQMADKAIQSVSERITNEFIEKIEDKELRAAVAGTMTKMDSADELISAFKAIGGNSELLHQSVHEINQNIEKFVKGEISRVDLMVSMADTAEFYITDTIEKMATVSAVEYGSLAPAIGKMSGYVAGSLFKEALLLELLKKLKWHVKNMSNFTDFMNKLSLKCNSNAKILSVKLQNYSKDAKTLLTPVLKVWTRQFLKKM